MRPSLFSRLKVFLSALVLLAAISAPAAAEPPDSPHRIDALSLPRCPMPSRVIAIVSTQGRDSLAVLSVPGGDDARWQAFVRVGDRFSGAAVGHIGQDRVWLRAPSGWCQITRTLPATQPTDATPASPTPMPRTRALGKAATVPPAIASSIRATGDNQFEVDRSVVDGIVEQRATLLRGVQVVPKTEGGKTVAVGLRGVRDGSLLHSLGLRDGDELHSINGFNVANPEGALTAYAKLRTADHLTISVIRGGKPMSIDVAVK
jgi:general secretion pathway protein C